MLRKRETVVADHDEQLASRVARIESDVAHIGSSVANLQVDFRELRREMGDGFKAVNTRIDAFYTRLDGKVESFRTELDGRIDALDAKGTRHFLWLLSTMTALALTVGGALLKELLAH